MPRFGWGPCRVKCTRTDPTKSDQINFRIGAKKGPECEAGSKGAGARCSDRAWSGKGNRPRLNSHLWKETEPQERSMDRMKPSALADPYAADASGHRVPPLPPISMWCRLPRQRNRFQGERPARTRAFDLLGPAFAAHSSSSHAPARMQYNMQGPARSPKPSRRRALISMKFYDAWSVTTLIPDAGQYRPYNGRYNVA